METKTDGFQIVDVQIPYEFIDNLKRKSNKIGLDL